MNKHTLTNRIREFIETLEFDSYSIIKSEEVNINTQTKYIEWLESGYNASMGYLENNINKRFNPSILVSGAKTIIIFTQNYYPPFLQEGDLPQIAYYAYGKDYHDVLKSKLKKVYEFCQFINKDIEGRFFCDSAPVLERYWAEKTGMGWIGKNSLFIQPNKGSYFFLASIILNVELEYDEIKSRMYSKCGNCTKCIDACPTKAIEKPYVINAQKCLSYQTIENKEDINTNIIENMNNRFFGCDICQQICPWNRFSSSNQIIEFKPSNDILNLTLDDYINLDEDSYTRIFKGSPLKRIKLKGLKRNANALKKK